MKGVWLPAVALLLTACNRAGDRDMQACHQEAQQAFPSESGPHSSKLDQFEKACMNAKGYNFSAVPYDCGQGDQYENAHCYSR
jgi:hypothetical protein